jgi:hypothetical protein
VHPHLPTLPLDHRIRSTLHLFWIQYVMRNSPLLLFAKRVLHVYLEFLDFPTISRHPHQKIIDK